MDGSVQHKKRAWSTVSGNVCMPVIYDMNSYGILLLLLFALSETTTDDTDLYCEIT